MNDKLNANQIRTALEQFGGGDHLFYQPLFKSIRYTEGIKYMADFCEAHWFLTDVLANCQLLHKKQDFISIKLIKEPNTSQCLVNYEDGNNNLLLSTPYDYTTFPLDNQIIDNSKQPAITLFFRDNILFLPSEY